jgi:hypothetical protein
MASLAGQVYPCLAGSHRQTVNERCPSYYTSRAESYSPRKAGKGSSSFLKKEPKTSACQGYHLIGGLAQGAKVFCFVFQKRNSSFLRWYVSLYACSY